ncbi:hypothetical protein C9374_012052 [Naegleria lovaniensis]|uniref:Calcium-transporting ATPase n=1 Tax=Naegleria lovaniensis TaxID=51637 RepID=A0AA88GFE1_NAELO|nr:uncharacterized protein C9374_012008 [Naegleria lovaniensis]XP_044542763.1 uncharacterized protein C9374_012052 [Naegleria lovaniensis]KAG2373545.1 hypothetical protein C9374_012008 [Naegleria lovaniensis]KAG2373589.1 hypothetical protein C9374_012052 [Naegleria lovaniensis]
MSTNMHRQSSSSSGSPGKNSQQLFKKATSHDHHTLTSSQQEMLHRSTSGKTATQDIFSLAVEDLTELHQTKNLKAINELGGFAGLAKILRTDLKKGIDWEKEVNFEERSALYGLNIYPEPPARKIWKIFIDSLNDTTLLILLFFSFISMVLGVAFPDTEDERPIGWIEGFAIFLAVAIVSIVVTVNDYSKERKFRSLTRESKKVEVKVIRSGLNHSVLIDTIQVGDIVEIEQGDGIPADGLCIESNQLKTDESVMTGEPDLIKKNTTESPFLLSGCTVAEGSGKMLITCVGVQSEWGRTLQSLKEADEDKGSTPLEEKLDKLSVNIGKMGMGFALMTLLVLILGYWIKKLIHTMEWIPPAAAFKESWQEQNVVEVVKFFVVALTIVVVAVPEGLPLAVTIALAYSVRKMMKDQNLVRHLAACETMGGANNICSDKTGTLTLNQMRVTHAYFGGRYFGDQLSSLLSTLSSSALQILIDGVVANSKANLVRNDDNKTKEFATQGSKTEAALLLLLVKHLNQTIDSYRERRHDLLSEERGCHLQLPFSSKLKRMSTVIPNPDGDTKYRLFTKGASEIVLKLCSRYMKTDGTIEEMNRDKEDEMMRYIEEMANQGLRTICLAYRDVNPDREFASRHEEMDYLENLDPVTLEEDLICVGIVGIKDPLRPEVPAAIAQCKKSGITVRMITGDNILTAKYIARECGILSKDGIAIEGPEFRKMTNDQIAEILPRLQVMARSSPTDKYNLVKFLKKAGNVVAVTGDGTNDAPALKEADVGLSMGLSGTQVAKEASDIIILDDNFSSIVKSVLWGRSIFENIRKFLTFQLTVNVVALVLTIVSAISSTFVNESGGFKPPLSPVQMLWINLIMDTFAALALATEPPIPELLDRKPYGRKESLITPRMWVFLLGQSVFQLTVLFTLYYGATSFRNGAFSFARNDDETRTVVFNAFVFCQVFNEYNARKINFEYNIFSGLFKSAWFISISGIIIVLQALIINFAYYDPTLIATGKNDGLHASHFTQTIPLNWYQWMLTMSIGFLSIPYGFVIRFVSRMVLRVISKKNTKNRIADEFSESATPESEL